MIKTNLVDGVLFYTGRNLMLTKEKIALSILVLQILGCTTTGKECVPPKPSASEKGAQVIVYRPPNRYGSAVDWPISIDDCLVGMLANGAFIPYTVAPGTRKIRAEERFAAQGGDAEISAPLADGETTYVRYVMLPAGPSRFSGAKAGFAVTDRISAERELPALRNVLPSQK